MGTTHPHSRASNMVGKAERVTLAILQDHFHLPMVEAAKKFDVCLTFFKRICRSHGIKRWPYRKLISLERKRGRESNNLLRQRLTSDIEAIRSGQGATQPDSEDDDDGESSSSRDDNECEASPRIERPRRGASKRCAALDFLAEVALESPPHSPHDRGEDEEEQPAKRQKCEASLHDVDEMNTAAAMMPSMQQQDLFSACGLPAGFNPSTDLLNPEDVLSGAAMIQRIQMLSSMLNQESVLPMGTPPPMMMVPPSMSWPLVPQYLVQS